MGRVPRRSSSSNKGAGGLEEGLGEDYFDGLLGGVAVADVLAVEVAGAGNFGQLQLEPVPAPTQAGVCAAPLGTVEKE